ncbi:hypothetical protein ZWY2020_040502 [Hordeum vulgare]|nr:hypothetical protein ZWY2020_040502 [Hordeum vulgare]
MKGDKFWLGDPKASHENVVTSKKAKGKGKSAAAEPSEVDESQVGDALSENSPPTSGDSVMSTLPPMIRVPGAQAKKRKTSGPTPDTAPDPMRETTPTPDQAEPATQVDRRESPREVMDAPKLPSPLTTTEDPDAVFITGSGFSKPAATVLSKHVASSSQAIPESRLSKAKLSNYANLEFKELCSGFANRVEASYEMEKNLLKMLNNKHEEHLAQTESALGDLRKNLAGQQDARAKSEEKCQLALTELVKLKAELNEAQAEQNAALKRAEKAEATLATVQQERSGLKRHISNMTQAVFEQYTAKVLTVKAVMGAKEPITSIKKILGCLSTIPPQIGELTRSAVRKGVLTALSRCLAYAPEINLKEVAVGFPQLKDDGSEFVEEDYQKVVKDSRLAATQLAASLDLTKYQAAYDSRNKKVSPPTFVTTSLTPRRPKNAFDLEANLASILTDEDDFAPLARCNWVLGDLQIEVGQSSRQDDPEALAK